MYVMTFMHQLLIHNMKLFSLFFVIHSPSCNKQVAKISPPMNCHQSTTKMIANNYQLPNLFGNPAFTGSQLSLCGWTFHQPYPLIVVACCLRTMHLQSHCQVTHTTWKNFEHWYARHIIPSHATVWFQSIFYANFSSPADSSFCFWIVTSFSPRASPTFCWFYWNHDSPEPNNLFFIAKSNLSANT
jgi:hypothetical protein